MTDRDIIKRAAEILKSRGCHAHGEFIERILSELPKPSPEDGKIIEFAVAIGREDFHDGGAVIHDTDAHAILVGEGVEPDQLTLGCSAKRRGDD